MFALSVLFLFISFDGAVCSTVSEQLRNDSSVVVVQLQSVQFSKCGKFIYDETDSFQLEAALQETVMSSSSSVHVLFVLI